MSSLATRRLIDAAATLDPPERALVNLWVNRGLDDAEVARMTGMSDSVIAERRTRIVEQLSDELGLPPEDVRSALNELVRASPGSPADVEAMGGNGSATPDTTPALGTAPALETAPDFETTPDPGTAPDLEAAPALETAPDTEAADAAPADPTSRPSSRRRALLWVALALVALVVLIVVLTSGGSSRPPRQVATSARPVATSPGASTGQSPPTPSTSVPLLVVPGGPAHATGTVALSRSGGTIRLNLSVNNLPTPAHGHYEVWLYDSLIYSEDLGRLGNGATHVSFSVPADGRRYPWVDVSLQPVGRVFHSGESLLRSTNPLFGRATPSSR